ncbi:hypothetical protein HELRODRAFT_71494, partial [Helobdella robusta]|uniref:Tubulin--tyrosine ligase-like protein 9 n=1 Tax=Helobdella robusta TaxID=6412 RepID=T1G0M3_HELRO
PTYFIAGNNGTALVDEILNGFGWRRIREKNDELFKLKWSELKASIDYNNFREGEQLVNHIPNCEILTNKQGLLNSLQEYGKINAANHKQPVKLDFFPETYKVDDPKDKEKFLATYKEDDIWICKPTGRNQGKGIFLIWNSEECYKAVTQDNSPNPTRFRPLNRIIQRYISNPLLINNRKFDIRCYMLIASTSPYVILYHKGYIRLSMYNYDKNSDNMLTHLTNQYIQKKDPKYGERKEDTVWSMDKFNDYANRNFAESKNVGRNWVYNGLTEKMKSIIMVCFNSVKNKLQRRLGYFELYGMDFLVDENMKVWLIEINMNPSYTINCGALKDVIPGLLKETLDIAIECFEKGRRRKPLLPLNSRQNYEVLY